jgi:hypothetical protein
MTEESSPCTLHPDAIAGWRCSHEPCKQYLCGKCTAQLLKLYTCVTCGGAARQLTVSRKSKPFAYWLGAALRYPFLSGAPTVAVTALVLGVLQVIGAAVALGSHELGIVFEGVRVVLAAGYVLFVIDRAARGVEAGMARRFAQTVVSTLILSAPIVTYVMFLGAPGPHDWALWLFAALALVYLPLALTLAATDTTLTALLDPFRTFEHMCRLGRIYLGTFIVAVILAALSVAGGMVSASIRQAIPTPIVADAVAQLPLLIGLAMFGRVIGALAYVHGDLIGWGSAALYVDPLFPRMVAEGRRKIAARPGAEAPGDPAQSADVAEVASAAERADAEKLGRALKTEELPRALRIYEARTSWSAASVDDRQLMTLAKAASRGKKPELAQRLLESACARNGRSAGQALLALAQLHADTLGQADKAREIYGKVVEQFPGSDVAKIAALQIGNAAVAATA